MKPERLSREQKGEGIHFDVGLHGKAKAFNGKPFADLTDEECDEALAGPEPKSTSRFSAYSG